MWRAVESPAFRRRFGRAAGALARELREGAPLRELAEAARRFAAGPGTVLRVPDASGERRACTAQAHYNRRAFLVLVAEGPAARRRAGAG